MTAPRRAALDRFRLIAAILVVANHTAALSSLTEVGDFWLTRVLARLAVPFFLMVTGYFLAQKQWSATPAVIKKNLVLYAAAVLLYLPLNLYSSGLSPVVFVKKLLLDGTFYHLWYFPAVILGLLIVSGLRRLGQGPALAIAAVLYLIGLGGDSYYALAAQLPALRSLYDCLFLAFDYTRNGLFYAPLFLLLGAYMPKWGKRAGLLGFPLSLAAMTAEGLAVRLLGLARHDSMYLTLPLCALCLFSLLLSLNQGQRPGLRSYAALVYLLHPWCIVLVRGGAKLLHLEPLLIDNSLGHFLTVLALCLPLAFLLSRLCPPKPSPTARAWRELDIDALRHNAGLLQARLAPGCRLMAVVKADAYGHGAIPITHALQKAGIKAFAVACAAEGIQLRRAGIRGQILVLGWTAPDQAPLLARWRLTQTVADKVHGLALARQGVRLHVHLALDTGMARLGIPAEDHSAILALYQQKTLVIDGVFSHLCAADSPSPADKAYTQEQLRRFALCLDWMRSAGLDPGAAHIQASYGILGLPCRQSWSYARAGIALYGVLSDSANPGLSAPLRPVLALRARVACVRHLEPGQCAGYGRQFQALRPTTLAVLAIGYADGLPRALAQQGGHVLLHGQRCPMVGRMCMDQLLVDVTELDQVSPGDVATLIGTADGACISAEEVAEQCGTITNELLSRLSPRLETTICHAVPQSQTNCE